MPGLTEINDIVARVSAQVMREVKSRRTMRPLDAACQTAGGRQDPYLQVARCYHLIVRKA